jgi:alpha-L-fucosidase 2
MAQERNRKGFAGIPVVVLINARSGIYLRDHRRSSLLLRPPPKAFGVPATFWRPYRVALAVLLTALAPIMGLSQFERTETNEAVSFAGLATVPREPLTLWYRHPARQWTEAMPVGNGRLGGMVWGRVQDERIDLNEDTLWSGEPTENLNTNGLAALPEIRALLLAGRNTEAQALVEQKMCGQYGASYMPLGQLRLEFPVAGEVKDYKRELDLSRAVCSVEFTAGGTRFRREIFASHPAQAIVIRFTSDRARSISFVARLESQLRHGRNLEALRETSLEGRQSDRESDGQSGEESPDSDGTVICLGGRCPIYVDPNFQGKKIVYDEAPEGKGERFEIRLAASSTGGRLIVTNGRVEAKDCDSVTLLLVAATSYNGPRRNPNREGRDPSKLCEEYLRPLARTTYTKLLKQHVKDYQGLFQRVSLNVEGRNPNEKVLPTDERIAAYEPDKDPGLAALYYKFGRYLLISCSRPGTQPANLQGLWNISMQPPWSCNWTLNCNAEINYWGAEAANLGECQLPLVKLTEELSIDGEHVARDLYGAHGWVAHHATDIWRQAGPGGGSACWSMFPVGSAWLCQHLWEHYEFSGDTNYLLEIWPTLKGAAEFYLDSLVEEPTHHWLVTAPDNNFENHWRKPNGETGCTCMGATGSMEMIRELFENCLSALDKIQTPNTKHQISTKLQTSSSVEEFRTRVELALKRLAPMQISPTTGELQEWPEDWQRTAECQALSSWGLICGSQITLRGTPELAAAVRKIFDNGSWWKAGKVGSWQGAFQANAYARLGDGDTALAVLETHLKSGVNPNFTASFPGHTQFQVDGNLGMMAAINEMLVQSREHEVQSPGSRVHSAELIGSKPVYVIELLPALPKEWANGEAKGLRARGGFEVDLGWKEGKPAQARIRSLLGNDCEVRMGRKVLEIKTKRGKVYSLAGFIRG